MDKGWSEKNKEVQKLLAKEATFELAIQKLVAFRAEMFEQITQIVNGYPEKAFSEMPFAGADGYHKYGEDVKEKLIRSKCVSEDENAFWLIDYWCGKDVKGLIQMPFSRHWIMHIEAMRRIKNKLCKLAWEESFS